MSPSSASRLDARVDGGTSGQLDATRARRGPMRVFLPDAGNTAL